MIHYTGISSTEGQDEHSKEDPENYEDKPENELAETGQEPAEDNAIEPDSQEGQAVAVGTSQPGSQPSAVFTDGQIHALKTLIERTVKETSRDIASEAARAAVDAIRSSNMATNILQEPADQASHAAQQITAPTSGIPIVNVAAPTQNVSVESSPTPGIRMGKRIGIGPETTEAKNLALPAAPKEKQRNPTLRLPTYLHINSNLFYNTEKPHTQNSPPRISSYLDDISSVSHPPVMAYPIMAYPIMAYPIMAYPIMAYPIMAYPIMVYPNYTDPFILTTDASEDGLGAVLYQRQNGINNGK
ncbi:hypothetical protein QZH41_004351 [Actinostola sp. cb2023]|nr:hypothetical protein QZH41_004351 [Actinostola sp. cb2023]